MSVFIPNDKIQLLRSVSAVDAYGDPIDTDTPIFTGLPAHIAPVRYRTYEPVSGQVTVINKYRIRLRPTDLFEVKESDRIKSESNGKIFLVDEVGEKVSPLQRSDLVLVCSIIR